MARSETGGRQVVSVGSIRFGEDPFVLIVGPGPGLLPDQLGGLAAIVTGARATMLRCGSAVLGLEHLVTASDHAKREKLLSVGMVNKSTSFEAACDALDMVEVEVASLSDGDWGEAVRGSHRPIMLRRDISTSLDDWLAAGDSLRAAGREVVLVSDSADDRWLQTALERSSLPIVVDVVSSHLEPSAVVLKARANGAHGAVVSVSLDSAPATGVLNATTWSELVFALEVLRTRGAIDRVDRDIVRLLGERQHLSLEIGKAKADRGLPVFAPERERELMDGLRSLAARHDLGAGHVEAVFRLVLAESRAVQERRRTTEKY